MIRVMIKLNKFGANLGKKKHNYLCIDGSEQQIKEHIVFAMEVKTRISNLLPRRKLFDQPKS